MHRAESVLQNCVMGRCAICIFIYCYNTHLDHLELFSWDRTGITNVLEGIPMVFQ